MESGGLPVNNTCLRASRSYYSLGLGRVPTTISTPGRKWGDRRLRVLSELLSRQLSHRAPNLSWQLCALTRYNIWGLTARGIWLWLARPTVLWCDGIDRGRGSEVDPMRSDVMRRSDGVRRAPSRQYSSARRQVLLLLGTRSCANDNKHSGKEVGGTDDLGSCRSYSPGGCPTARPICLGGCAL
jgi:hypothetical protein